MFNKYLASTVHSSSSSDRGSDISDDDSDDSTTTRGRGGGVYEDPDEVFNDGGSFPIAVRLQPIEGALLPLPTESSPPQGDPRGSPPRDSHRGIRLPPMAPPRYAPELRWGSVPPSASAASVYGTSLRGSSGFSGAVLSLQYPSPVEAKHLLTVALDRTGNKVHGQCVYFVRRAGASVVLAGSEEGEGGEEEKGGEEAAESEVLAPGMVLVPGMWALQCLFVPRDTALFISVKGPVASVLVEKGVCEVSFSPPTGAIIAGTPLGPAFFCAEAGLRATLPFSPYRGLRAREAERARRRAEEAETERTRQLILGHEVEEEVEEEEEEEEDGDESKGCQEGDGEEENEEFGEGADDDEASARSSSTAASMHPSLVSVPGRFDYSHAPGSVLCKGTHSLVVKFTPSDLSLFRPSYARATVTVGPPLPELVWPALPALYFNTPLGRSQLRCVIAPHPAVPSFVAKKKGAWDKAEAEAGAEEVLEGEEEGGTERSIEERLESVGTFTYSPPEGTLLPIGLHTLSVSFCPHSDRYYSPASRTQTLAIVMAHPALRWPAPPPLYLGDGLDRRHLCVTTDPAVEGSFVYTPPLGAALTEGPHSLHCRFEPADPEGYHPAEASAALVVHRKRTVAIHWSQPRPLVYPAPLTRLELSASVTTAGVRGTFEFDPPLGTVLDATEVDEEEEEIEEEVVEEESGGEIVVEEVMEEGGGKDGKPRVGVQAAATKRQRPVEVLHTLTATFRSESKAFLDTTIRVSLQVFRGTPRLVWPALSALIEGEILQATSLCCRCLNLDRGQWLYDPPPLTQLLNGEHPLRVTFTPAPEDRRNWRSAACATTLTVNKRQKRRTKVVWPGPLAPIRHPQKLSREQCCATSPTCDGSFYYSPAIGSILDVGTHNLKVTFMPAQSKLYAPSDTLQSITVLQGTAELLWRPDPALCLLPYGIPLPVALLCATSDAQGDITYAPAEGAVLDSGEYLLAATLTPRHADNFLPTTAHCPLKVTRHTPLLEWDALPPVTYPTILTSDHFQPRLVFPTGAFPPLAAEGLAKGKYKFSHKPGACPNVGRHTLKCRYTPADGINFFSAECRVRLDVGKGSPFLYHWRCAESLVYGEPLSKEEHLCAEFDMDASQVEITYDPPAGHVFDSVGLKTVTLTLAPHDTHNYLPLSLSRTIAVEKQAAPIRWTTPVPIQFGTRLGSRQLCAEIDTARLDHRQRADLMGSDGAARGEFRYSPAIGAVLEVGADHLLTVTFHPSEAVANFRESAPLRVLLEVKRSAAKLSAQPGKGITYGEALQAKHINASVRNADAQCGAVPLQGTLFYEPPLGTVLLPGRHAILLTFSPINTVNAAPDKLRIFIDVYKAIPVITWPAFRVLRLVRAGYRLTADDCTATVVGAGGARVAGQFFFTPPAGTILGVAGIRDLSVEFIPTAAAQQLYHKPPPHVVKIQVGK